MCVCESCDHRITYFTTSDDDDDDLTLVVGRKWTRMQDHTHIYTYIYSAVSSLCGPNMQPLVTIVYCHTFVWSFGTFGQLVSVRVCVYATMLPLVTCLYCIIIERQTKVKISVVLHSKRQVFDFVLLVWHSVGFMSIWSCVVESHNASTRDPRLSGF